jgi:NADPH-dependent 2,4-dienoyl-CoA reductase/sulfur reductase-like enzyme
VGGEFKDPSGLFYSTPEKLRAMGISVNMEHDVIEINQEEKYILVKNLKTGKEFKDTYDKLVYAGGS